jgi:ABC-type dipeptide/oligopeptide/nickel transport system permease subunit
MSAAALAPADVSRSRRMPGTWPERVAAVVLLGLFAAVALGPVLAPYGPDQLAGVPFSPPSTAFLLGTDTLGRDVLSRILNGGQNLVLVAFAATLLAYLAGGTIGLAAAYLGGVVDSLLMRLIDLLIAFPPILLLLVLVSGAGHGGFGLTVGIAAAQFPPVARIVRAAALEVRVRGYVEAAAARGERTRYVLFSEILPNIRSTVMADFGSRFTVSVLLVAALGFLGVGVQPPAPNWASMISENQDGLSLNPWAVVAPALVIAALTVSANLLADGVISRSRARQGTGTASR